VKEETMSKVSLAPTPAKGQGVTTYLHKGKVLELHPVSIALAKAEAARWLLAEIDAEVIGEHADKETLGWVGDMALRELADALTTARAEFVKAAELHRSVL
jgi:hypothetical protein